MSILLKNLIFSICEMTKNNSNIPRVSCFKINIIPVLLKTWRIFLKKLIISICKINQNTSNILRLQDENHSGTFEGSEQGLTLLPSDRLVIQKVSQEVDDDDTIHIYYDEVCVCLFVSLLFIPKTLRKP